MNRLLSIALLLLVACRENTAPESQTVTTAGETTETASQPVVPVPATPSAPVAPAVAGPKLMPVDEATTDPALVTARETLLGAVRQRDVEKVLALADPSIRTSFGGGAGREDLRKALEEPGRWDDLERLLRQGGSFMGDGEGRSFWAPYVFSAWPDSQDAFEMLAITGEDVPLREAPAATANVVATLSYDLVQRAGAPGGSEGAWRQIKTADGRTGWVAADVVRSPIAHRVGFMKRQGQWRWNAFVAGD